MSKLVSLALSLLCMGAMSGVAHAAAQPCGTRFNYVPTKTLRISNNTPSQLWVIMQSPNQSLGQDLWMQAVCGVTDWTPSGGTYVTTRGFNTSRLYRAYVWTGDPSGGIPPGGRIEIQVPFYTQLQAVTTDNLGKLPDQYIDWFNGGRTYLFDSFPGYVAAYDTNNLSIPPSQGGGLPPPDVTPYAGGAMVPTCQGWNAQQQVMGCYIVLKQSVINPPDGVPFQLQELTFTSAEGPPLNNSIAGPYRTNMLVDWVNYNVSSLDSVFLPVAMGPLDTLDPNNFPMQGVGVKSNWVGSAQTVSNFRQAILNFSNWGADWPIFMPAYYDGATHPGYGSSTSNACSLIYPFKDNWAWGYYNLPVIPGTYNVLAHSWTGARNSGADFPPVPPSISSNPSNWWAIPFYYNPAAPTAPGHCSGSYSPPFVGPAAVGTRGNHILDLWRKCLSWQDRSATCQAINALVPVFRKSYESKCTGHTLDWTFQGTAGSTNEVVPWQFLAAVYGWVPPAYNSASYSCEGADLSLTAKSLGIDFKSVQESYCVLQYNYLQPGLPPQYIFNPYTQFSHGSFSLNPPALGSTAYAFSIDDALSFIHFPSTGAIIAVGGTSGLVNQIGQPVPTTLSAALQHCKAP